MTWFVLQVRNIPEAEDASESLKAAIEACGVNVRSIAFEEKSKDGKQSALVRFAPLPLPWTLTEACLASPVVTVHPQPEVAPPESEGEKAADVAEVAEGEAEAISEPKAEELPEAASDKKNAPQAPVSKRITLDDGRRDGDAAKMSRFCESLAWDCSKAICY